MSLRSHLEPLRVVPFRRFFGAELVNSAGSSMAGLALAFAVLDVTDSAAALGWVAAARTVPMVALMMFGGALADQLPRNLVLRGCNLVQGAVQAIAAVLVLTGSVQVWHLVVLGFVSGTVFSVSYPAFHGMVPTLLPAGERKAGFLLMSQSDSAVSVLGPAVAGVLVAGVGPGWALAADAATYLVAAFLLARITLDLPPRTGERASVVADFVEGWSYVRGLGWLVPVACCSLVFNALISGALGVLGPLIADGTIGSQGWGLARSAEAFGVFAAVVVLARVSMRWPLRVCLVGFALSGLPMLVLGLRVSTPLLMAAFVVAGVGLSAIGLAWNLLVSEKVPEEMLSRVMSIDGFFSFVAMPIGQVAVGPLVVLLGTRGVEVGSAALCVVVLLAGLSVPAIRRVRLDGTPGGAAQPS